MSQNPAKESFLIVGIGASAGGIKALKSFFKETSTDSRMAYVVILHLSPDFESKLAEIIQTVCVLPVEQVMQEMVKVKPGRVYVIPPNKSLKMSDGHLTLSPILSYEERRAPVDIFFRTLAESHAGNAVAVILSGTGPNGSMGIKRIKEKGGLVIVQDLKDADYDDMPRNSMATGLVDFVLPASEIPSHLVHYQDNLTSIQIRQFAEQESKDESDEKTMLAIFTQLRLKTGHDFLNYKRATILRRIERRMNVMELYTLGEYAKFLYERPEETQILLKDLLISVTNFFRDKPAFNVLENEILARILEGKTSQDTVRIWVAGCATGEEAYSVAMLCAEHVSASTDRPAIQIFATDIDEAALQAARDGYYTNSEVADVSPERLQQFFIKDENGFRIIRDIREMVLFARQNVLKDPPFSRLDLVTCRNLLIYLNRIAQTRVIETFHFALNPGGYLFLGSSESAESAGDLFAPFDRENCIFQSRAVASRPVPVVPEVLPVFRYAQSQTLQQTNAGSRALERLSLSTLHQQILELYAPPSVLVNGEYDIIHLSESAGRYLHISGGEPTYNLLQVVLPELRLDLRGALYHSAQERIVTDVRGLPVHTSRGNEVINLVIKPLNGQLEAARGFLLVLFEPSDQDSRVSTIEIVNKPEPIVRHLEDELTRTRLQLRSTAEQYEVQAEEFKASNEELQAINEELRSAAEELETSKEELQSVNEELKMVNQELKVKIEELSLSNSNFQNLINSTDVGTIFLDRNFCVRLFTPAARDIFNLIDSDFNRPLSDITNRLSDINMSDDAKQVLQSLNPAEREVTTKEGRTYLMRISPYRTDQDRINGLVITFFNITGRKHTENQLAESEERLRIALEAAELAAWDWNLKSGQMAWNKQLYLLLGVEPTMEKHTLDYFLQFVHDEDRGVVDRRFKEAIQGADVFSADFRINRSDDSSVHWIRGFGKVVEREKDNAVRITGVMSDVTKQKMLEKQKEEFIGIASHELKTPVTSIKAYTEVLEEMFLQAGEKESAGLMKKMNVQVDRLTGLITNLLDTTRISDGYLILQRESCDINETIKDMAEILQHSSGKQKIEVDLQPLAPIMVDGQRISQVLTNLIINAIKYAPESGKIVIHSYADGDSVKVGVQDFGKGVPDEIQDKIFERFFRLNDGPSGTYPGLGLGLYITSEIIKQHGGRIWVESQSGKGSTFYFTLPRN